MKNIIFGFLLGAFCYMSISSIASAEKTKETPYQDRALKAINESLQDVNKTLIETNRLKMKELCLVYICG